MQNTNRCLMCKVCFYSHHFGSTVVLLRTIQKMTPGRSGQWKDMIAVVDPFEADYVIVLDGMCKDSIPLNRAIYFAQHPLGVPAYRPLTDKAEAIAVFPNDKFLNPGEWWISYSYDELSAMEPPIKTKDLISITTYQQHCDRPTYNHRIRFLEEYVLRSSNIDIYGRQETRFKNNSILRRYYRGVAGRKEVDLHHKTGDHIIGKDIEKDYRYALDFDHGKICTGAPVHNYFSERFYDSMLLWTMPLYFGSDNVEDFLPKDSFVNIDISGEIEDVRKNVHKAIDIVNSDFREQHLKEMKEARELLLNKYQLWPFVYDKIKTL